MNPHESRSFRRRWTQSATVLTQSPPFLDRILSFLFVLLCASLPLSKGLATTAMLALLILSLAKAMVERLDLRLFFRENYPLLVLSAVFFAYLISLGYSSDLDKGLKFIEREIPLLLIPVIVAINRSIVRKKLKLFLGFFLAGCLFNAFTTLFFYALPESQSIAWVERLGFMNLKPYQQLSKREAFGVYSPFLDRLQFSNLLALACMSCLWMLTQSKSFLHQLLFILAGLVLLFCSVILGGKGGQLALARRTRGMDSPKLLPLDLP